MRQIFVCAVFLFFLGCQENVSKKTNFKTGNKEISLEDIWGGTFATDRMNSLNSMEGDFYSLLERDEEGNSTVEQYSYQNLKKTQTLVDGKSLSDFKFFSSYKFNSNESKVILGKDLTRVYRRSTKGTYAVLDLVTKKLTLIGNQIQEPTFAPDGNRIAYAKNNDLHIFNVKTKRHTRITKDGKYNHIINGTTDWVYEEEFGFVRAFEWSKDGNFLAFLRFDESKVQQFEMGVTGNKLYPSKHVFKYPKAGEDNAKVTLHMYNTKTKITKKIALGKYEYIARIKWSNDPSILIATTLNRHQNNLNLHSVNALRSSSKVILNETDKAYVDIHDNLTFLKDNSFIWTSEKDGYNHIYHYDENGKLINQITKGNWEVTRYYGFNETKKTLYYQSVENGSINKGVYSIELDGQNKKLLSEAEGTNTASFSKNLNFFINTHSSSSAPPVYALYSSEGDLKKVIKDNKNLQEKIAEYKISPKEFSTIRINGHDLNMWMIKPANFDKNKQYPLLMFQYSGPGSQQVANRWNGSNDYWHQMLAQEGIIIACVDGRGTGYKGRDFKKMTYKELGKLEVEDQIAAAKQLADRDYIDQNNIGIWGWSYGGFMSTNCILKGNDVFSTAIAVAPVTSWRFYDTVYTERYMQTPQENPGGYDDNSPINYADQLEGNYLLVHGTGDDNVHAQNSMRMINALVEANKQFDLAIYPDRAHGIYKGKNTRLHLYKKMTSFIQENLNNNNNRNLKIKG